MAKYDPLLQYLKKQTVAKVRLSFAEIEHVIGTKLPNSAYRHRPWWANEASTHVHAKAWLDAGYETEAVDMRGKRLVFKRGPAEPEGMAEPQRGFRHDEKEALHARHPIIGALKGLLRIDNGVDLTQPAMPEWAELIDDNAEKRK